MSCGSHHGTPCAEVLALAYVFLDNEIDEERRVIVATHLTECSPCDGHYAVERRIRAEVRRCCGGATAPDGVRTRIVAELRQISIRIEDER